MYDVTVAAGRYLCNAVGHLGDDATLTRAYLSYNHSDTVRRERPRTWRASTRRRGYRPRAAGLISMIGRSPHGPRAFGELLRLPPPGEGRARETDEPGEHDHQPERRTEQPEQERDQCRSRSARRRRRASSTAEARFAAVGGAARRAHRSAPSRFPSSPRRKGSHAVAWRGSCGHHRDVHAPAAARGDRADDDPCDRRRSAARRGSSSWWCERSSSPSAAPRPSPTSPTSCSPCRSPGSPAACSPSASAPRRVPGRHPSRPRAEHRRPRLRRDVRPRRRARARRLPRPPRRVHGAAARARGGVPRHVGGRGDGLLRRHRRGVIDLAAQDRDPGSRRSTRRRRAGPRRSRRRRGSRRRRRRSAPSRRGSRARSAVRRASTRASRSISRTSAAVAGRERAAVGEPVGVAPGSDVRRATACSSDSTSGTHSVSSRVV